MPDRYLRQSALAHLGLVARATERDKAAQAAANGVDAGVRMGELPYQAQVGLRGDADDPAFVEAVRRATGAALPVAPCTVAGDAMGLRILWMGPDEWLVVAPETGNEDLAYKLTDAVAGLHAAVWPVSDSRTVIALSGDNARDVLMKGCPLDVHPRAFQVDDAKGSTLGLAHITLHMVSDAPAYHLYVHRSFAEYLWAWLEDAANEYGLAIDA